MVKKKQRKKPVPKPSTLLKRALELLGPKGERWIQGTFKVCPNDEYQDPLTGEQIIFKEGAYCAIGALKEINTPNEEIAKKYLLKAVNKNITVEASIGLYDAVYEFNDEDERKFVDIKKLFKKAIRLALKDGK